MNQSETSFTSQIGLWASRPLADYDAHNPGTLFAEGIVLNVALGYELQMAVAKLRRRRVERIVGYKVGCTSPRIRSQLQIEHCVAEGFTTRSNTYQGRCPAVWKCECEIYLGA